MKQCLLDTITYVKVSGGHFELEDTIQCYKYMCPGFAWSEYMNYLRECNAKLYVLVTVWEMIVFLQISMGGTIFQSELILVPPMVYLY